MASPEGHVTTDQSDSTHLERHVNIDQPDSTYPEDHVTTDQPESPKPEGHMTSVPSFDEVLSLRQALQASEEQTQLINGEYKRLLREKEVKLV